jgi:hypothetical protein
VKVKEADMATFYLGRHGRTTQRWAALFVLFVGLPFGATPVFAQSSRSFTDALFALKPSQDPDNPLITVISGRLFGGSIAARIRQADGRNDTFEGDDVMTEFLLSPTEGHRPPVQCRGLRAEVEDCLKTNASAVLEILFPHGLSSGAAGVDVGQFQAQQMLVTSAFGAAFSSESGRLRRSEIGGLAEAEWFNDDNGLGGQAWQGFYRIKGGPVSIRGRYADMTQEQGVRTKAFLASLALHPSFLLSDAAQWRAGIDLRTGLLYAKSPALDVGALDMGAGVWSSFAKDISRVRIGGGGALQASRNFVPSLFLPESLHYIAEAISDMPVAFDIAYGGLVGVLLSKRTSFNAKLLQTRALNAETGRPRTQVLLGSLSYLIGGHTPIDVGYKLSTGGGLTAHAVFLQGNYRF